MPATCPCKVRTLFKALFKHSSLASVCKPRVLLMHICKPRSQSGTVSFSAYLFSQWLAGAHVGACCQPAAFLPVVMSG